MTDPPPTIAVSPTDQSSDRAQSDEDQALNTEKLDRLITGTDDLTKSNETLALAMVEYQERAKTAASRFRLTMAALGVLTILVLSAIGYVLAKVNESVAGSVGARREIISCVTPGQPCYDQAQVRSAALVTGLVDAIARDGRTIAARAAACAPEYVSLPPARRTQAIYQCIVRRPR